MITVALVIYSCRNASNLTLDLDLVTLKPRRTVEPLQCSAGIQPAWFAENRDNGLTEPHLHEAMRIDYRYCWADSRHNYKTETVPSTCTFAPAAHLIIA